MRIGPQMLLKMLLDAHEAPPRPSRREPESAFCSYLQEHHGYFVYAENWCYEPKLLGEGGGQTDLPMGRNELS
jgi:hypothetical protein